MSSSPRPTHEYEPCFGPLYGPVQMEAAPWSGGGEDEFQGRRWPRYRRGADPQWECVAGLHLLPGRAAGFPGPPGQVG
jgi:hypothetical protein